MKKTTCTSPTGIFFIFSLCLLSDCLSVYLTQSSCFSRGLCLSLSLPYLSVSAVFFCLYLSLLLFRSLPFHLLLTLHLSYLEIISVISSLFLYFFVNSINERNTVVEFRNTDILALPDSICLDASSDSQTGDHRQTNSKIRKKLDRNTANGILVSLSDFY